MHHQSAPETQNKPRTIKAFIFDCDGTLVNSERIHYLSWKHALQQYGYELTEEVYIQSFIGVCDTYISKMTANFLGFDYSEKLLKDKNEYFHQCQLKGIAPIASTIAFLKHLIQEKERYKLKLAVASGSRKQEIMQNLINLGIEDGFDVILSGIDDLNEYQDPEGTNKPKPYIFQKTAQILDLTPQQCIAIEDSRTGISAAIAAGCITIAVPNDYTRLQDLSQAHLTIESADLLGKGPFWESLILPLQN